MRIRILFLVAWCLSSTGLAGSLEQYKAAALKWEKDIQAFEKQDQTEADPKGALLFVGSSSIRLWSTIQEDMAPYPVIQRGYGGAKLSDVAWYAKRIIYPHQFKALILFVANDISGGANDKAPEAVADLFQVILNVVRDQYPDTPVFFIEITPTAKRWNAWPKIREANQRIKALCIRESPVYFIDTSRHFLDEKGRPNKALFREDQLHLNRDGYALWTRIIKRKLATVLP